MVSTVNRSHSLIFMGKFKHSPLSPNGLSHKNRINLVREKVERPKYYDGKSFKNNFIKLASVFEETVNRFRPFSQQCRQLAFISRKQGIWKICKSFERLFYFLLKSNTVSICGEKKVPQKLFFTWKNLKIIHPLFLATKPLYEMTITTLNQSSSKRLSNRFTRFWLMWGFFFYWLPFGGVNVICWPQWENAGDFGINSTTTHGLFTRICT